LSPKRPKAPTKLSSGERKRLARPTQSAHESDVFAWRCLRRDLGILREQLAAAPPDPETGRQALPAESYPFCKDLRQLVTAICCLQEERIRTGHLPDDSGFGLREEVDELAGRCFELALWLVQESIRRASAVRPVQFSTRCVQLLSESWPLLRKQSRKEHDAMRRALEAMDDDEIARLAESERRSKSSGRRARAEAADLSTHTRGGEQPHVQDETPDDEGFYDEPDESPDEVQARERIKDDEERQEAPHGQDEDA
jgi:hypothetical protein